jgi:guanylate kinase
MKKKGMLIVISGPTGAGKDKIIQALLEKNKDIFAPISSTTRTIKLKDVEEKEYNYISTKEFFKMVDQGAFLEWAEVYGNYYGTSKHQVNKALKDGKKVLLEVDIKGALQIKEKYSDSILIFILPNSIDELKNNIINSQKDTLENLIRKFDSAYNAIETISTYNYGIINDDINNAVIKIENIISAEECRVERLDKVL